METTREGPVAPPRSALDMFFDNDGVVEIYGPAQLSLSSLAPDGPAPYEIHIGLVIDGVTHAAALSFPSDVDVETSSMLPDFSPELPAASPADYAGDFL